MKQNTIFTLNVNWKKTTTMILNKLLQRNQIITQHFFTFSNGTTLTSRNYISSYKMYNGNVHNKNTFY